MICKALFVLLAAVTIGPAIWRYVFHGDMQLKDSTRDRIRGESARADQAREQMETTRGRRQKVSASEPIGRYREFQG